MTYEGYGYLYNWYAIGGNDGRAPGGIVNTSQPVSQNDWRVPTEADYNNLISHLGGSSGAGGKCKTINTSPFLTNCGLWNSPNTGATNETMFTGVPGGFRSDIDGTFYDLGTFAYFWTSTEVVISVAKTAYLTSVNNNFVIGGGSKNLGISIRLVRPATIIEQTDLPDGTTSNDTLQFPSLYNGVILPTYVGNNSNEYLTVKIGAQVWTIQNLVETWNNQGNSLNIVIDNTQWAAQTTGAVCSYNNELDVSTFESDLCGVRWLPPAVLCTPGQSAGSPCIGDDCKAWPVLYFANQNNGIPAQDSDGVCYIDCFTGEFAIWKQVGNLCSCSRPIPLGPGWYVAQTTSKICVAGP
jgi:uncharacterized protein (TIGR02145 family)